MIVLISIFFASLARIIAAVSVPGMQDTLLLAVPCAIASLVLIALDFWKRRHSHSHTKPQWIVIDGSNVLYWQNGEPQIEAVQDVLDHLAARGFTPGVVFDANAGYLISGKYEHDGSFGNLLGLPEDRVMVVPKGTPADPTILTAARDLGGRIVTNDRFRDWSDLYPEIGTPGYLIKGGYRNEKLWLDLKPEA